AVRCKTRNPTRCGGRKSNLEHRDQYRTRCPTNAQFAALYKCTATPAVHGRILLERYGEDGIFSPTVAPFDEKMAFSRRRSRPPTRRWHFLDDGRALRREDGIFSPTVAPFDEKMAFSRRRSRPPTRRWHFLDDGRALRREDGVFSTTVAPSVEK